MVHPVEMQVGRAMPRTNAIMVMSIDELPSKAAQDKVAGLSGIERARFVTL